MKQVPSQRICILGNSGSGKSTLADELGRRLDIPVFHLDRVLLHDQFILYDSEQRQIRHNKLLAGDRWIIDGNYRDLMMSRLEKATLAIFLDVSRLKTVPRVFSRYFTNSHLRASIPENAKAGLSWKLIRWVMNYSRRRRYQELMEMVKINSHVQVLVLPDGTTEEWVQAVLGRLNSNHPIHPKNS